MKRLVLAAVFIFIFSGIVSAQSADEGNQTVSKEVKERQLAMAMQLMGQFQKQMVATSDGGVVVMAGNKLYKYDKDLNLVKDAQLTTNIEINLAPGSMQQMIDQMREKYGKRKETAPSNDTK